MTTSRVLVLGGTEFVGRAVVDEALARGHDVTVLNRGTRAARTGVTTLVGDRTAPGGLDALRDGEWDRVIDTWSWAPRVVAESAALLADRAERYVYVSSRSVYAAARAGDDESAPLVQASSADDGFDDYAHAKAGGELGAVAAFGDRALLLRPGLILGPYENIGRLPWWLSRIARGGGVVAPGPADAGIQYIDARDLAGFALEADVTGPVNTVSQRDETTMRDILRACIAATGADASLRWFDADELAAAGAQPWTQLPLWLPPGGDYESLQQGDVTLALGAGLSIRPLRETVDDTWTWLRSIGGVAPQRPDRPVIGLPESVERRLLDD
jgi:2'-hydroxyisoflavone reductase